ncbi:MAG TPA: acyloxyacyl hydrolase [Steroidobacteraceae bacterium]|nr:acyloxyacyl hydrolase [Steroidobacteraceae bacterium]
MKRPGLRLLESSIVLLAMVGISQGAGATDAPISTDAPPLPAAQSPSRWSYDFETAYVFVDIQNPFWLLAGQRGLNNMKNPWHYRLDSYVFGGRYDLSKVGGWGFLRGQWQTSVGLVGADILHGPEHYYAGLVGGLRYIFVPGDGTWAPYIEFREAVGKTDASRVFYGQQDDTSFMYLFGFGMRYQPDRTWRISLGIVDQHMSDAYLTKYNYGFDSVGAIVAVEWR